jgi:hypothetical protein
MIIVLSGWRGITDRREKEKTAEANHLIIEACAEVLRGLFLKWPDGHYRVGDCKTGIDDCVRYLWNRQNDRNGWLRGDRLPGSRTLDTHWVADFRGPLGKAAGPDRNRRMLVGDGGSDDRTGIAHLLVAMPEPGPRREGSGTWSAISIAHELGIPTLIEPLAMRHRHLGGDRLPTAAVSA